MGTEVAEAAPIVGGQVYFEAGCWLPDRGEVTQIVSLPSYQPGVDADNSGLPSAEATVLPVPIEQIVQMLQG